MGDADRRALQKFQLRCALDDDGIAWERSDFLWIEIVTDGKHQLKVFALHARCRNHPKDIRQTSLHCSPRREDERFPGYSLPREIYTYSTVTIVNTPGT